VAADAHSPARSYEITDGRTPDGRSYRGTMDLSPRGMFLDAVARLDPLGERHGLAMPFGRYLVLAFGPKDKVEIGAYRRAGEMMQGVWVPPGAVDLAACGHEPSTGGAGGVWTISRALAIDNQPYHGTLRIEPAGGGDAHAPVAARMTWTLHDGEYKSFGLDCGDAIFSTFNFEPGTPHGIAVYERSDAQTLRGTIMTDASMALGHETLRAR
jgi:hypothetical protein